MKKQLFHALIAALIVLLLAGLMVSCGKADKDPASATEPAAMTEKDETGAASEPAEAKEAAKASGEPLTGVPIGTDGVYVMDLPAGYTYDENFSCYVSPDHTVSIWASDVSLFEKEDNFTDAKANLNLPEREETIGAYQVFVLEEKESFYGAATHYFVCLNDTYFGCQVLVSNANGDMAATQTEEIRNAIATIRPANAGEAKATEPETSAVESLEVNFSGVETAAMSASMNQGQYVIDGRMVYGQGYTPEGQPCLTSFEISGEGGSLDISNPQILLENNSPSYVQLIDDRLYFMLPDPEEEFEYRGVYSLPKDNGDLIPITDKAVEFCQFVGDKLYYKDEHHHLVCAETNGENPIEILAREIYYPYIFNTNWLVYQDDADGESLHLMYLPTGEDLVICDKPSYCPVIAEHYLYFVIEEQEVQHLARIDLNAIEAEPNGDGTYTYTFETETSDKNVVTEIAFTADGYLYVGGTQGWELAQWQQAENPDGNMEELVKASSEDYKISWVFDTEGYVDQIHVTELKGGGITPVQRFR